MALVVAIVLATAGTIDVKGAAIPHFSFTADTLSTQAPASPRSSRPIRPERRHTSPITTDTFAINQQVDLPAIIVGDSISTTDGQTVITPVDSIVLTTASTEKYFTFNPDPTRAVWMSALCPGLGQLYNRRYWKLPIVVGAFLGLGYATNWNNTCYVTIPLHIATSWTTTLPPRATWTSSLRP